MKARSQPAVVVVIAWLVAVRVLAAQHGDWVPWIQLACTVGFGFLVARPWALLVPVVVLTVSVGDLLLSSSSDSLAGIEIDHVGWIVGLAEAAVAVGMLSCHGLLKLHVLRSRRRAKTQSLAK